MDEISLDGLRMHATQTAPNGMINAETIFEFRQEGELVDATYAGGRVRRGHLVGMLRSGRLEFRFAQVDTQGAIDGGVSCCDIERTPDGRVRLVEHFEWGSQEGSGTNIIEELPRE